MHSVQRVSVGFLVAFSLLVSSAPVVAEQETAVAPAKEQFQSPIPQRQANVLLIMSDALRFDHLGCYGYSRNTSPNIDQLASEGVVFDRFYCHTSWTRPSIASLFTSKYPGELNVYANDSHLPKEPISLAQMFGSMGFKNAAAVCNAHLDPFWGFSKGFDNYIVRQDFEKVWVGSEMKENLTAADASRVNASFFQQLRQYKDDRFFFFVFYADTHAPYTPPEAHQGDFVGKYKGRFDGTIQSLERLRQAYEKGETGLEPDIAHIKNLYDACIRYVDDEVGRVVKELKRLNVYDNTLIVLSTDHGEAFFEHGYRGHGFTMYEEEARIPLIIRGPGVPQGKRVSALASMVDIMPSLVEYAGGSTEPEHGLRGKSFWRKVYGQVDSATESVFLDLYRLSRTLCRRQRGIVTQDYKLIEDLGTEKKLLFDLKADPKEIHNCYEERPEIVAQLKPILNGYKKWSYKPEKPQVIGTDIKANQMKKSPAPKKDQEAPEQRPQTAQPKDSAVPRDVLENLRSLGYME